MAHGFQGLLGHEPSLTRVPNIRTPFNGLRRAPVGLNGHTMLTPGPREPFNTFPHISTLANVPAFARSFQFTLQSF